MCSKANNKFKCTDKSAYEVEEKLNFSYLEKISPSQTEA